MPPDRLVQHRAMRTQRNLATKLASRRPNPPRLDHAVRFRTLNHKTPSTVLPLRVRQSLYQRRPKLVGSLSGHSLHVLCSCSKIRAVLGGRASFTTLVITLCHKQTTVAAASFVYIVLVETLHMKGLSVYLEWSSRTCLLQAAAAPAAVFLQARIWSWLYGMSCRCLSTCFEEG